MNVLTAKFNYSISHTYTAAAEQLHSGLTIDVEHHVPHGRTDRLMETKPHLPASAQRMVIALRRGEKRTPHWSVPVSTNRKDQLLTESNRHGIKPT